MSNGGADVLYGGEGDDILAISDATVAHLKGGTGTDTLRFDGAGVTLDLTALRALPEHHSDTAGHPLAGHPLSDHRHPEQRHSGWRGTDALLGSKLPTLTVMCTTSRNTGRASLNSTGSLLVNCC